eukprot:746529-Hanusia_phi.AAC.2
MSGRSGLFRCVFSLHLPLPLSSSIMLAPCRCYPVLSSPSPLPPLPSSRTAYFCLAVRSLPSEDACCCFWSRGGDARRER